MNPYSKRLALYAGLTTLLLLIVMIELGVIVHSIKFDESKINLQDRATAVAVATALSFEGECGEISPLVERYCGTEAHFQDCALAVSYVERSLGFSNQEIILGQVKSQQAQLPPKMALWAVDTVDENDNAYKDSNALHVVSEYNNTAYFYAQKQQRQSAGCWSWSLQFWRAKDGKRSLQLVFCDVTYDRNTRVCAAFDVGLRKD